MARRITLRSPLDPIALATRLKSIVPATVDRDTPAGVIGRGSEQDMRLWYYRPNFRNDLQTTLTATIDADGSGSRITGRLGAPTGAKIFLVLWTGIVSVFLVIGLALLVSGAPWQAGAGFSGAALFMLAIGGLIGWVGLRHDRADAAAILDFLARTVDAR